MRLRGGAEGTRSPSRALDYLRQSWTDLRAARPFGLQLARASACLVSATLLTGILGYLYWTAAARGASPGTVGYAAALVSAMALVSALGGIGAGLGMTYVLPRAGARWSATVNAALALVFLVSALLALGFVCGAAALRVQLGELAESPMQLWTFVATCAFWSTSLILDDVLMVERCAGLLLLRHAVAALVRLGAVPIVIGLWGDDAGFGLAAAWGASALISTAIVVAPFFRRNPSGRQFRADLDIRAVTQVLPLAVKNHGYVLMAMAPYLLLPLMVSNMLSLEDNAYYYTTWMITMQLLTIVTSTNNALFAHTASAGVLDRRHLNQVLVAMLAVVVPAALFLLIAGQAALGLLGSGYGEHGGPLLVWLALLAIPKTVTELYATVMRVRRRFGAAVRLISFGSISTLAVAGATMRAWGLPAVGIAYFSCFSAAALYCAYDLWWRADRHRQKGGPRSAAAWLPRT